MFFWFFNKEEFASQSAAASNTRPSKDSDGLTKCFFKFEIVVLPLVISSFDFFFTLTIEFAWIPWCSNAFKPITRISTTKKSYVGNFSLLLEGRAHLGVGSGIVDKSCWLAEWLLFLVRSSGWLILWKKCTGKDSFLFSILITWTITNLVVIGCGRSLNWIELCNIRIG